MKSREACCLPSRRRGWGVGDAAPFGGGLAAVPSTAARAGGRRSGVLRDAGAGASAAGRRSTIAAAAGEPPLAPTQSASRSRKANADREAPPNSNAASPCVTRSPGDTRGTLGLARPRGPRHEPRRDASMGVGGSEKAGRSSSGGVVPTPRNRAGRGATLRRRRLRPRGRGAPGRRRLRSSRRGRGGSKEPGRPTPIMCVRDRARCDGESVVAGAPALRSQEAGVAA